MGKHTSALWRRLTWDFRLFGGGREKGEVHLDVRKQGKLSEIRNTGGLSQVEGRETEDNALKAGNEASLSRRGPVISL